jgi:hypothetical protein
MKPRVHTPVWSKKRQLTIEEINKGLIKYEKVSKFTCNQRGIHTNTKIKCHLFLTILTKMRGAGNNIKESRELASLKLTIRA